MRIDPSKNRKERLKIERAEQFWGCSHCKACGMSPWVSFSENRYNSIEVYNLSPLSTILGHVSKIWIHTLYEAYISKYRLLSMDLLFKFRRQSYATLKEIYGVGIWYIPFWSYFFLFFFHSRLTYFCLNFGLSALYNIAFMPMLFKI